MIFPQIRCYHSNVISQPHVFYILCKGENAGKPALRLWPNSFTVICSNQQYFDFYFWLMYGLFKSNKFKIRLRGTAVPFLNLDDIRDIIREVAPVVFPDWSKFQELIKTLDKLVQVKTTLAQQIIASENLQKLLLQNYFNALIKTPATRVAV